MPCLVRRRIPTVDQPEVRPRIKYAMSLDQDGGGGDLHYFIPRQTSPPRRSRPPLQHSTCFDQSDCAAVTSEENNSPETPALEDPCITVDTPVVSEVFRFLEHSDNSRTIPESVNSFGDCIEDSYERSFKNRTSEYFYDRPGPSSFGTSNYFGTSFSLNDPLQIQRMSVTALFEKFCADERAPRLKSMPVRQTSDVAFRTNRLKGISADRLLLKKTRQDRISTSSLGDQPVAGSCFTIFDKRKGKLLGKLEKSKRLSTSVLYDQSPTSTSNFIKPSQLRSNDFTKKYHSEEFSSSPGNHAPTSKSDNSVQRFKYYDNPLERASVARLYEKYCNEDKSVDITSKFATLQGSLDGSEPKSAKTEPYSAASLSERTSDIMSSTLFAIKTEPTIFNFDLEALQRETSDTFSEVLSPDRSASASNTMQLLFEDPRSNRTSISDIYEPCFSVSLTPKQPSIKRDRSRHWDLNTLDLRPIDDESPSKPNSESSPDNLQSDTRSNNSDVFVSSANEKGQMLEDINEDDTTDDVCLSLCDSSDNHPSKTMSSRPSMQKLEPFKLVEDSTKCNSNHENENNASALIAADELAQLNLCTVSPKKENKREKETSLFRLKKVKDKDCVAIQIAKRETILAGS